MSFSIPVFRKPDLGQPSFDATGRVLRSHALDVEDLVITAVDP